MSRERKLPCRFVRALCSAVILSAAMTIAPSPVYAKGKVWALLVGVTKYGGNLGNLGKYLTKAVPGMDDAVRDLADRGDLKIGAIIHLRDDMDLSPPSYPIPDTNQNKPIPVEEGDRVMTDSKPTKDNITDVLSFFGQKAEPNDVLIFYFTGHGFHRDDEALLPTLMMTGTKNLGKPKKLFDLRDLLDKYLNNPAIFRNFQGDLTKLKRHVFIDACRTAETQSYGIGWRNYRAASKPYVESGIDIFYSTSRNNLAFPDVNERMGYFTKHLIEGIKGSADTHALKSGGKLVEIPGDGTLRAGELSTYVTRKVVDEKRDQIPTAAINENRALYENYRLDDVKPLYYLAIMPKRAASISLDDDSDFFNDFKIELNRQFEINFNAITLPFDIRERYGNARQVNEISEITEGLFRSGVPRSHYSAPGTPERNADPPEDIRKLAKSVAKTLRSAEKDAAEERGDFSEIAPRDQYVVLVQYFKPPVSHWELIWLFLSIDASDNVVDWDYRFDKLCAFGPKAICRQTITIDQPVESQVLFISNRLRKFDPKLADVKFLVSCFAIDGLTLDQYKWAKNITVEDAKKLHELLAEYLNANRLPHRVKTTDAKNKHLHNELLSLIKYHLASKFPKTLKDTLTEKLLIGDQNAVSIDRNLVEHYCKATFSNIRAEDGAVGVEELSIKDGGNYDYSKYNFVIFGRITLDKINNNEDCLLIPGINNKWFKSVLKKGNKSDFHCVRQKDARVNTNFDRTTVRTYLQNALATKLSQHIGKTWDDLRMLWRANRK